MVSVPMVTGWPACAGIAVAPHVAHVAARSVRPTVLRVMGGRYAVAAASVVRDFIDPGLRRLPSASASGTIAA
jgi:hypothetical protein